MIISSWREQHVLRMPAATIGIQTEDEWKAFYSQKIKETVWGPGSFAPALCSYSENGPMIDYILLDSAPRGRWWLQDAARLLWYNEEMKYLPFFQESFPGFTLDQMDDVHCCEYK